MRSGYALQAAMERRDRRGMRRLVYPFKLDLSFWGRIIHRFNGQAVNIERRSVHRDFFSVDACTGIGMGGFLDGKYFPVTWAELREMPQKSFYPFKDEATSHINFLELFVIYWALSLWGDILRGLDVVIWTDNTAAEAMVKNLWGKATFIPLLKEIWLLYLRRIRCAPAAGSDQIKSKCGE